jgi:hypothetical protein
MPRRNALPPGRRASEAALDSLIDPGTSGTSGFSVTRGTPDNGSTSDSRGSTVTSGIRDNRDTSGTRGASGAHSNEPRDHVKLRRSLADEMRDAVWFLSEHGRPRVQLGEILDEAVERWLTEVKQEHNGGEDFPRRGRLR